MAIDEINRSYCLNGSEMKGTVIELYPGDSFKAAKEGEWTGERTPRAGSCCGRVVVPHKKAPLQKD